MLAYFTTSCWAHEQAILARTVYSLIVKSEIHAWILSIEWDYPRSYTNQLEDFQGSAEKSSNCKGYGAVAKNYSRG